MARILVIDDDPGCDRSWVACCAAPVTSSSRRVTAPLGLSCCTSEASTS